MIQISNASTPVFGAVIINPVGASAVDRKLSILSDASSFVCLALSNEKGDVGKAARAGSASMGLDGIVNACSNDNYRPLAQYLAVRTGKPIVISNVHSYRALPDMFEQAILVEKGKKSGGYKINKDGLQVPTPAHQLALTLYNEVTDIISRAQAHRDAKKAAHEARMAEAELAVL